MPLPGSSLRLLQPCFQVLATREQGFLFTLPYSSVSELPKGAKKLAPHRRKIFMAAFNNALKEYDGDEAKAFATAYAAAKRDIMDPKQIESALRAFDPDYCMTETWDMNAAIQAQGFIVDLIRREAAQNEEDHVHKLAIIFQELSEFISEELDEALTEAPEEGEGEEHEDGTYDDMGSMRASPGEKAGTSGHGGYLVGGKGGKHLPTRKNGKVDPRLMGAAWAALHGGYRGKSYQGPDRQAAIAKLTRLYKAHNMDTPASRSADLAKIQEYDLMQGVSHPEALRMVGETRFAQYAFRFQKDPQEQDLLNTHFTKETDYGPFIDHAPIYYHHAQNPELGLQKIGKAVRAQIDEIGLWVEGELDKSNKYWRGIVDLIKKGRLYYSGGSAEHLLSYGKDGEVRSYPIVEWTLTPTPAEFRLLPVEFLRSIGVTMDNAADGAADGKGVAPTTRQKRSGQEREVRNIHATNLLEELNMDPKELAEMIAKSTQEAVRAQLQADKDAAANAAKQAADEAAAKAKAEADHKALVEKVTAEVRASLPAVEQRRPPYPGNGGQYNIVPNTSLGEFSYLKACRGIVLSFWGKPNAWQGSEKERDIMVGAANEMRSTLSENIGSLGAYLVPPQYMQDQFIPLLRSRTVVRGAGPVVMQANSNVVYIPSQTGGATAYWVGENSTLTASNLTVGQMSITIKKLAGLEYVSNELLADSNPSVDQMMRNDLAAVLALAEDTAYLAGTGTANQPLGMSNYPGITSLTCASDAGNGGAIQAKDIFYMKLKMMQNNIPNDGWAWFMSPRTWDEIAQLKDSQNRYLLETLTGGNISQYPAYGTYPEGPETNYRGAVVGRLLGWPVYVTNNISETQTQGTSSTCSSLYLVRLNDVIIAERQGLELMATNVAGTSFATDQTWIRAIMRVGFGIRHAPAVEVMVGLT